jgi:hypothetical protein
VKKAAVFRNLFSIRNRRVSYSISLTDALSIGLGPLTVLWVKFPRIHPFAQSAIVYPNSLAVWVTGRPVWSGTNWIVSALNGGEYFLRCLAMGLFSSR